MDPRGGYMTLEVPHCIDGLNTAQAHVDVLGGFAAEGVRMSGLPDRLLWTQSVLRLLQRLAVAATVPSFQVGISYCPLAPALGAPSAKPAGPVAQGIALVGRHPAKSDRRCGGCHMHCVCRLCSRGVGCVVSVGPYCHLLPLRPVFVVDAVVVVVLVAAAAVVVVATASIT